MTTEQMTVHKALAELKIIDDRINGEIANSTYVIANKHSNEKIHGITLTEFRANMKADFQRINDLILRRNAIKRAVVASNAVTKVKVGDTEYTVAEAIEMKNHGMELSDNLRMRMSTQYTQAKKELDMNSGEPLERRAEQYVLSVIQAQPKEAKMTVDSEGMKNLRKQYIADNTYDLIDPLNIKATMDKMSTRIDTFMTEIDAALSVSNALTVLTIEY